MESNPTVVEGFAAARSFVTDGYRELDDEQALINSMQIIMHSAGIKLPLGEAEYIVVFIKGYMTRQG